MKIMKKKNGSQGVPLKVIGFHPEGCTIFNSLSEAARHVGSTARNISLHIQSGKLFNDWSFNYYIE